MAKQQLVQMNLSVDQHTRDLAAALADDPHWRSQREVVTTALDCLAELMERYRAVAEEAADDDVGALFLHVAHAMPATLSAGPVTWGRFNDGRPVLILDDWYVAEDLGGDLMAVRADGSQIGQIVHGRIEVIAEQALEGDVQDMLTPDEIALN